MLKRRRLVFLNEEVTNPGRAISRYQAEREQPPTPGSDEVHYDSETRGGAEQMQQSRQWLAVLTNIVRPKRLERVESCFTHERLSLLALYDVENRRA